VTFIFPDEQSDPTYPGQALTDSVDLGSLAGAIAGTGIVSGCAVTALDSPAMAVAVAAGSALIGGSPVTVNANADLAIATASSHDRRDIVVVDDSGDPSVVAGDPCFVANWVPDGVTLGPVKPAVPSGFALIAEVYVAGGITSITNGAIVGKQLVPPSGGGGGGAPTLSLSYNGNGPVECQVLNGLSWNPAVGGFLDVVLPGALSGFPVDIPAVAEVNGSGVIQGFAVTFFNEGSGLTLVYGPTGNQVGTTVPGLRVEGSSAPGNTNSGVDAVAGQLLVNTDDGSLWVCTTGYDPDGPVDAVWFTSGSSATVLDLSYGGSGPFSVPVTSTPAGYTPGDGIVTLDALLTVGTNIGSGLLLDANSNPIPDGWTFPAVIFVEGNTIYDIIATNGYTIDSAQGGLISWGASGGAPVPVPLPGGLTTPGVVVMSNLPTSDPSNAGQLWNHNGTVVVSGTSPATHTLTGSVGGTAVLTEVNPGTYLKQYTITLNAFDDAGGQTFTFATPFAVEGAWSTTNGLGSYTPTPAGLTTSITLPATGGALTGVIVLTGV